MKGIKIIAIFFSSLALSHEVDVSSGISLGTFIDNERFSFTASSSLIKNVEHRGANYQPIKVISDHEDEVKFYLNSSYASCDINVTDLLYSLDGRKYQEFPSSGLVVPTDVNMFNIGFISEVVLCESGKHHLSFKLVHEH